MHISEFHHVNDLSGVEHRPDFKSLDTFGDMGKVESYMSEHSLDGEARPLRRLVLIEDFVGTGTQMESAARLAAKLTPAVPVLCVPLVICPQGVVRGRSLERELPNFRFEPVMELRHEDLVGPARGEAAGELEKKIAEIAGKTFREVAGENSPNPRKPPYGPFGFKRTGAQVVMYSNTPNNTLPLLHHERPKSADLAGWSALFPRVRRI